MTERERCIAIAEHIEALLIAQGRAEVAKGARAVVAALRAPDGPTLVPQNYPVIPR